MNVDHGGKLFLNYFLSLYIFFHFGTLLTELVQKRVKKMSAKGFVSYQRESNFKITDVSFTKPMIKGWKNITIPPYYFLFQNFIFARLNKKPIPQMKFYAKSLALMITLMAGIWSATAQDYTAPDSTSTFDMYADTTAYSESGQVNEVKPVKKPYVRFVVPFDTLTELVTYTEVVNEDEAVTDSLYFRAKRWIIHEFGKKNKKQVIKKDDKKDFKIVMEGEFPLMIENNKFSKTQNGKVMFDMELRFKDGRYKYKINNLVHVVPPPPGEDKEIRTYFEFYRKSTVNPKGNDMVLIAADKKIKTMIKDLKKYCKEPIFVDEDDW